MAFDRAFLALLLSFVFSSVADADALTESARKACLNAYKTKLEHLGTFIPAGLPSEFLTAYFTILTQVIPDEANLEVSRSYTKRPSIRIV